MNILRITYGVREAVLIVPEASRPRLPGIPVAPVDAGVAFFEHTFLVEILSW